MTKNFKKQTIAVSNFGRIMVMEIVDYGFFHDDVLQLIAEHKVKLPAGIYVVDILYTQTDKALGDHQYGRAKGIDIDICYQLAEYRDKELYSGEVKLT